MENMENMEGGSASLWKPHACDVVASALQQKSGPQCVCVCACVCACGFVCVWMFDDANGRGDFH